MTLYYIVFIIIYLLLSLIFIPMYHEAVTEVGWSLLFTICLGVAAIMITGVNLLILSIIHKNAFLVDSSRFSLIAVVVCAVALSLPFITSGRISNTYTFSIMLSFWALFVIYNWYFIAHKPLNLIFALKVAALVFIVSTAYFIIKFEIHARQIGADDKLLKHIEAGQISFDIPTAFKNYVDNSGVEFDKNKNAKFRYYKTDFYKDVFQNGSGASYMVSLFVVTPNNPIPKFSDVLSKLEQAKLVNQYNFDNEKITEKFYKDFPSDDGNFIFTYAKSDKYQVILKYKKGWLKESAALNLIKTVVRSVKLTNQ